MQVKEQWKNTPFGSQHCLCFCFWFVVFFFFCDGDCYSSQGGLVPKSLKIKELYQIISMRDLKSWPFTESGKQLARPTEKSLKAPCRSFSQDCDQHFHAGHDREKDRSLNDSYREKSWGAISQDLGITS